MSFQICLLIKIVDDTGVVNVVAHQQCVSTILSLENMFSQEEVILSGLSGAPMMIRGRVSQDILRVILCSADPTKPTAFSTDIILIV